MCFDVDVGPVTGVTQEKAGVMVLNREGTGYSHVPPNRTLFNKVSDVTMRCTYRLGVTAAPMLVCEMHGE